MKSYNREDLSVKDRISSTMFGSMVLFWVVICLLFFLVRTRRPKNFPPGPQPLPIFGNLLQLCLENPMRDLERLRLRYGNVFSLFFGSRPAVILNGTKAIREALVTKASDFAGRPDELLLSHLTQGKGVIMANYGPSWRDHRRFALMTLRNFGLGKQSMEDRILSEVEHVAAELEESNGKPINPKLLFHNASCDIICSIMYGCALRVQPPLLPSHDQDDGCMLQDRNGPGGDGGFDVIYDTIPLLRGLPSALQETMSNITSRGIVAEHRASRIPKQPRDVIDNYLDQMDKMEEGSVFDEEQMLATLLDLLFAGTDTTSNTICFAVFLPDDPP
ncbi:Cytochrome P450 2B4 [Merluccius polli]|uniref:Cytochrome P450 2B4 n=1 Tax=Merluccius polli TaxID=89951 RepID=A0AA47MBW7_MERPO|nr:Cytochrome P450 2B4 [Merluccius polli]